MPHRVLVVDDDPILCELIQEVLSAAEMEVYAVTDSSQAAARLKEKLGDFVIYPSGKDGLVRVGRVKRNYKYKPQMNPKHPHVPKVKWQEVSQRKNFTDRGQTRTQRPTVTLSTRRVRR